MLQVPRPARGRYKGQMMPRARLTGMATFRFAEFSYQHEIGMCQIGSAGGFLPPPPTPPDMRVRVRRFLAVLADEAALFLCHGDRCPVLGQSASAHREQDHRWSCSACQVQPFPSCEAFRYLRVRLVALGTKASAYSCQRSGAIADPRSRRFGRGAMAGLPE